MADKQDEIEQVKVVDNKEIVTVNGEDIVVSSATEKPNRSLWIAWLYIFDVSTRLPARTTAQTVNANHDHLSQSGTQGTTHHKRRSWCENWTWFF
jgi:hypothetical protein